MIGDPNSNYPPGVDGNHPHIRGVSRPGLGAKPTNKLSKSFGLTVRDDDDNDEDAANDLYLNLIDPLEYIPDDDPDFGNRSFD